MKFLIAAILLVMLYIIWQRLELTRFSVREYKAVSGRIQETVRGVVIADLHGFSYGKKNSRLIEKIRERKPQFILIPGDMVVSKYAETFPVALDCLLALTKIAPVYYSFGNHESRLRDEERLNYEAFWDYIQKAQEAGVQILNNESREIRIGKNRILVSGLELPLQYYEKGREVPLEPAALEQIFPNRNQELFHILLAHNPGYAPQYAAWGADVTFCGHNHGGLIRIPGIGSLISPQLTFFPKYDAGEFTIHGKKVIVSRGLGTHTFHIRIFNRAELLEVQFMPQ